MFKKAIKYNNYDVLFYTFKDCPVIRCVNYDSIKCIVKQVYFIKNNHFPTTEPDCFFPNNLPLCCVIPN